jgi:hypothetical protein
MTYYRVALWADHSATWQWESRVIGSLDMLFWVLGLYRTMHGNRMRVFFASSVAYLDEMLGRENTGLQSSSLHGNTCSGMPLIGDQ